MKALLLLSTFLFTTLLLSASKNGNKMMHLKKVNHEIEIDGRIDPVWDTADSVSDFTQHQPYYGKEPTRRTVAKLLTTDEALYCLIVSYDDYKNIQKITGKHDDSGGDFVSLMLDTFGDKRTAYKFAVSASGITSDARLLDDARNRDYNWDGVWFASSEIYDWGYVVEMKIPYRSIQYDEHLTEWGLDFDRWIPALNEDIYWCSYEENEGQRISKFGKLLFEDFQPSVKGLNLEIYPVGLTKAEYLSSGKYKIEPQAGIDIFYNPSPKLTYQLTANPDFAQIEADPYDFNISRYESYFSERRPFFTEGNEIFMPSGKESGSGFYSPMELFYSRRIGKKLPDGSEVPLIFGTKAFGRIGEFEYGGFLAMTGEKKYLLNNEEQIESRAYFGSARIKKQIMGNSSIGLLFVGKHTKDNNYGVLDIDGAFRESNWQLSYQLARSFKNSEGDYAASAGFLMFGEKWLNLARFRYVGEQFDVNQVGFVPWRGTVSFVGISGPRWYFEDGYIRSIIIYGGASLYHEKVDSYTDHGAVIGFNMQLRDNWGYEINFFAGNSKDADKKFTSYEISLSSWYHISPKWRGNLWSGYSKTYNFYRDYLAYYSWMGSYVSWNALDILSLGTSLNIWLEGKPEGGIEDITYNARPFFSLTPVNNLNVRLYVDDVFVKSTDRMEQIILGLLFSYNFSPKSWIYFALNEFRDRSDEFDGVGNIIHNRMHVTDRAGVFKIKYLYYF
jgi:hypothetical protein